ncbi:1-deoxy-D-xylulose-5-phosphate reductoisomerase [Thermodesulforhabdus norvegica]|uniref:1-deoxy-D-xylulose 5-phosphate reductoisomerase n=1 Tax=Thermodesulforhabdus norvegica TaxID=39841 RepID=A0A1I4QNH7_9BACT|nr:1-deoxy-D-xylulose-5-phosphate reductoisomerase [Thermodesulforhabdus norvegica]SFM41260.1 1-deoxy-D-xylulose 5-phosphate reductoisomerase [Thermodesulforhabdus norvegica]
MMGNTAKKNLVILGSTGSIGRSTLDIVSRFPDRFKVLALAAGKNVELLAEQIRMFRPQYAVIKDEKDIPRLARLLDSEALQVKLLSGTDGYRHIAALPEADLLVSAIVGAAGLLPTYDAVRAGKTIALANKETLVIAGKIITSEARKSGASILPVDSEHNAVFQALQGHRKDDVKRIILTASGGPFYNWPRDKIEKASPDQALKHPNWSMGAKITIDSATLMNKGLEIIEAHWLFEMPLERIAVVIHPESIIHSMVEYIDGSVIAQMAIPDMRIPIAYALSFPARLKIDLPILDLIELSRLSFLPPDEERFPCLRLAREACARGGTYPAVLNAANEVAVQAFLEKRIGFYDIPEVIQKTLEKHGGEALESLEQVLETDKWAREVSASIIAEKRR